MTIGKSLIGAAVVALGGCNLANDDICTALPPVETRMEASLVANAPATDPSARVFASTTVAEFCIQQTARKFARAEDRADVVADAVVAHCREAVSRVVAAHRSADSADNISSPVVSFSNGRITTLEARTFGEMEQLALARVVEARAGNCRAAK